MKEVLNLLELARLKGGQSSDDIKNITDPLTCEDQNPVPPSDIPTPK